MKWWDLCRDRKESMNLICKLANRHILSSWRIMCNIHPFTHPGWTPSGSPVWTPTGSPGVLMPSSANKLEKYMPSVQTPIPPPPPMVKRYNPPLLLYRKVFRGFRDLTKLQTANAPAGWWNQSWFVTMMHQKVRGAHSTWVRTTTVWWVTCGTYEMHQKCITYEMHYIRNALHQKCIASEMHCIRNALHQKCIASEMHYIRNASESQRGPQHMSITTTVWWVTSGTYENTDTFPATTESRRAT